MLPTARTSLCLAAWPLVSLLTGLLPACSWPHPVTSERLPCLEPLVAPERSALTDSRASREPLASLLPDATTPRWSASDGPLDLGRIEVHPRSGMALFDEVPLLDGHTRWYGPFELITERLSPRSRQAWDDWQEAHEARSNHERWLSRVRHHQDETPSRDACPRHLEAQLEAQTGADQERVARTCQRLRPILAGE
ncbi:MAG: hypothetical protein EOO75_16350, partial [Myxococcales bacterium]